MPDELPEGAAFDAMLTALKSNDIVKGKFLSNDGQLALAVLSLNREVVAEKSAKVVIGGIEEVGEAGSRTGRTYGEARRRAGDATRNP